jgi:hypothetical protein
MSDGSFYGDNYDPASGVQLYSDDTAPAGGGGDPYGGDDMSWMSDSGGTEGAEAASPGVLPGGSDGQWSPFSPNQGFDATDVMRNAAYAYSTPGGSGFGTGAQPALPNLGTMAMPRPLAARGAMVALGAASSAGDIVRFVRQNTGLRVTARSIVGLIVRYGFQAAAALTQLDFGSLLKLFMRQKGVTHHRRGPGLYTVARKLRAADRLRATAARILGRSHGHRRRAHRRHHHFGRKRR